MSPLLQFRQHNLEKLEFRGSIYEISVHCHFVQGSLFDGIAVDEGMAETFAELHEDVVEVAPVLGANGLLFLTKNGPDELWITGQN